MLIRFIRLLFRDSALEPQAPLEAMGVLDVDNDTRAPIVQSFTMLKGEALIDAFDGYWEEAEVETVLAHDSGDDARIARLRHRWLGRVLIPENPNSRWLASSIEQLGGQLNTLNEVCQMFGFPMAGDFPRLSSDRPKLLCQLLSALMVEVIGWPDGRDRVSQMLLSEFDGCGLEGDDLKVALAYARAAREQIRFLRFSPPPRIHEIEF